MSQALNIFRVSKFFLLPITFLIGLQTNSFGQINNPEEEEKKGLHSFDLSLRFSFMSPQGTIQFQDSSFSIETTFPEEGESIIFSSPTLAGSFGIGPSDIHLGWNPINFTSTSVIPDSLIVTTPDTTVLIPQGTEVISDISMNIFSVIWTKELARSKRSSFGLGAGLMFIDYRSTYRVDGYTDTGEFGQVYPAPMLSVAYTYELNRLELQALIGGVGVKIKGNEVAYMNLDAAARFVLFRSESWLGLFSAGVKFIPFHLLIETEEFKYVNDMTMAGPFAGVRFRKFLK
jgi:hypothetical protein